MMEQRSPEWFAARLGKVTASRVADVVGRTKSGGYAAARENYKFELALERITKNQVPLRTSMAMQWGIDTEPLARAAYESTTGNFVTEIAIVDHPTIAMSAASPDGLVDDDGLIEIKCPESKQHFENLNTRKPDSNYVYQMQWQMACTGRQWCDFVSYDPRFPERLQLLIVRIERDQAMIDAVEKEVTLFLKEVSETVERIMK